MLHITEWITKSVIKENNPVPTNQRCRKMAWLLILDVQITSFMPLEMDLTSLNFPFSIKE